MPGKELVTVELRFIAEDAPQQLVDRIEEAVATIVGRPALEEFRSRRMPLEGLSDNQRPV